MKQAFVFTVIQKLKDRFVASKHVAYAIAFSLVFISLYSYSTEQTSNSVPTYDNAYANINFGGTGVTIQNYPSGSNGLQVGNYVLYKNVRNINGVVIDCFVRVDSISTGSTITHFDQAATSGSGYSFNSARFLSLFANFPNGKATGPGGNVKLTFQFIAGGTFSYNSSIKIGSGSNIQLLNVRINCYDIDGNGASYSQQSVRFGGFISSEMAAATRIAATYNINTGLTAFTSKSIVNTVNAVNDTNRVRVMYDTISRFQIKHTGGGVSYTFLDFGLGAPWSYPPTLNYQIIGKLYDDGNGATDNIINGNQIGLLDTNNIYINVVNSINRVLRSQKVDADGTFTIAAIPSGVYKMILTKELTTINTILINSTLPENWVSTGEFFGLGPGSDGLVNGKIDNISVNAANIENVHFGVNKLPNAIDYDYMIASPKLGDMRIIGKVDYNYLGANDFENGLLQQGGRFGITSLPSNGNKLMYNGAEIIFGLDGVTPPSSNNPYIIASYDTTKLAMVFSGLNAIEAIFTYSVFDAANFSDPTPAVYRMWWTNPLPVTFISVEANLQANGTIKVDWSTASEVNNELFEIERMRKGETGFIKIGEVKGGGTVNEILEYSFMDNDLNWEGPKAYYRIKQIDYDGAFDYSQIASVLKSKDLGITVYPNPTSDAFTVSAGSENDVEVRVLDSKGVLIYKSNFSESIQINTHDFANGTYFVKVTEGLQSKTIKLLISR